MNGNEQTIAEIEDFLRSDEKCMLLTGTNNYEKHKLIMHVLDNHLDNELILFRTNSMQNITAIDFLGWAGIGGSYLKAGQQIKIGRNVYECDSQKPSSTWSKTSNRFSYAIMYPIDPLCEDKKFDAVVDLFNRKVIRKVFLVSCIDKKNYDYSFFQGTPHGKLFTMRKKTSNSNRVLLSSFPATCAPGTRSTHQCRNTGGSNNSASQEADRKLKVFRLPKYPSR